MRSRSALLSCGCWRLRFPAGLKVPGLFPRSSKYEPGFSSCVFLSCCIFMLFIFAVQTSKYPLRGYILGVLKHTTALDRLGEVMELWPCGFEIEYTHLGFASAGAVWFGIWTSDHVVLNSSIRTLASPRLEQSDLASGTLTMWFWNWLYAPRLRLGGSGPTGVWGWPRMHIFHS